MCIRDRVDDDAADQIRDLSGVILGGKEGTAHRDMGNEDRREDGADGVGACQQCNGNAVEAHRRQAGGVQRVPLGHIGKVVQARTKTGQRTGNGHGEDDVLLLVDAGIAGSALVQADCLELVAEGGLVQHHPCLLYTSSAH